MSDPLVHTYRVWRCIVNADNKLMIENTNKQIALMSLARLLALWSKWGLHPHIGRHKLLEASKKKNSEQLSGFEGECVSTASKDDPLHDEDDTFTSESRALVNDSCLVGRSSQTGNPLRPSKCSISVHSLIHSLSLTSLHWSLVIKELKVELPLQDSNT